MTLSEEFTSRIDCSHDTERLEEEIEILYHILYRNRNNVDVRLEMIEKIQYITQRVQDIKKPPS